MSVLAVTAVTKLYAPRPALENVTLELPEGSTLGLLGPNGAGKTTLLRLLLGFARPTSGTVRLHGLDPADPEARRGVGYLPERLVLPAGASVRSFLRLQARLAGLAVREREGQVAQVMERVGIADRANSRIGTLSKGLRQRVGFAQALLGPPRLLLLDEPTSGLDPLGIRDAREWVAAVRAAGSAVLVSSHILSEVEQTCDRLVILHRGQVAASGPRDQVVREGETLEDAFVRAVRG